MVALPQLFIFRFEESHQLLQIDHWSMRTSSNMHSAVEDVPRIESLEPLWESLVHTTIVVLSSQWIVSQAISRKENIFSVKVLQHSGNRTALHIHHVVLEDNDAFRGRRSTATAALSLFNALYEALVENFSREDPRFAANIGNSLRLITYYSRCFLFVSHSKECF